MANTNNDPFTRPRVAFDEEGTAVMYARTYIWIRAIVAFLGIGLPLAFIVGEAFYLRGEVHVRGSISAYYHTSMRDLFVAGLCVIGFLLITYMIGQPTTADFWVSLVAGIAVIGVVFFPTWRPGRAGSRACGDDPVPTGCSPVQQHFGETRTAQIHFACAVVFIVCLAVIAFLFAHRERSWNHVVMSRLQIGCGISIVGAIAWVAIGKFFDGPIEALTPLYVGEVVSVWAFGLSWLLTVRGILFRLARPKQVGIDDAALSTG